MSLINELRVTATELIREFGKDVTITTFTASAGDEWNQKDRQKHESVAKAVEIDNKDASPSKMMLGGGSGNRDRGNEYKVHIVESKAKPEKGDLIDGNLILEVTNPLGESLLFQVVSES